MQTNQWQSASTPRPDKCGEREKQQNLVTTGTIRRPLPCPKQGVEKQGTNTKKKQNRKKVKSKGNEKDKKENKKTKKVNTVGMHQLVDFPLSPSKSYSLPKKRKKDFCLGINYLGPVPSKPLIPTAGSFSWEINYIERKRSSSLVSFFSFCGPKLT